ncbi:MAG: twin-arginine translocase subunit TatC [Xanthomonadales bacterium]|jgi:sec-independent protein translocase protein TatC|nr:twin-arginine translocase subunit TatC [Xanthomonadales bacterium]
MSNPTPGAEDDAGAPLLEHLVELRARLLKALAGVLLLTLMLLPFGNVLYGWLALPVLQALGPDGQMIATDPIAPFLTPLKLSFFTALIAAAPWVLYQIWAFVAPGLYRNEQRLAMPLLVSATLLFYLGCAFAYAFVLPVVFAFTVAVSPEGVAVMTDITRYLDFVVVIFLAFGVAFEVPVATVIIVALGWANVEQLRAARSYVIVGAFVIAAILTPPDVISQLMLAIPMALLYEIGILASAWLLRSQTATPEHS